MPEANPSSGGKPKAPDRDQLALILREFVEAETWYKSKRILLAHPELLSDELDYVLAGLMASQSSLQGMQLLVQYSDLLARCKSEGIDVVFAPLIQGEASTRSTPEYPDEFEPQVQRLAELLEWAQGDPGAFRELVAHLRGMLRRLEAGQWPLFRAALLSELGTAYRYAPIGDRVTNLAQAVDCYQEALAVYSLDTTPYEFAETQIDLGNAYALLPDDYLPKNLEAAIGRDQSNMERAVKHYTQAMQVYTPQDFPFEWAATQNNLGLAHARSIRGDRAETLERAIAHHSQALEVYTPEAFPAEWAATQHSLAAAYAQRIRGDRAENLERAIAHGRQALEVFTRQDSPGDWVMTQNNLANVYVDRIHGERAENLEQAIAHYTQALEVYTRRDFPAEWAMTQNNLGLAYESRIRGERAENLEQAIVHYTQALEVYTRQVSPAEWAIIQHSLAGVYYSRIHGERAENLEQAITHYSQALQIYTRQGFPERWATTQNNLGVAYRSRIRAVRAENLEQAIGHHTQALKVYTRQDFPFEWAATHNNLGLAYRSRIRGERGENLEQAIEHHTQALKVYTRQDFPSEWAATHNNLANAYARRIYGYRADNLERAIEHYTQAMQVYTPQDFPFEWAASQNNLGLAYGSRIGGERTENLERAIDHFTQALEVHTRQDFPSEWAATQNNLGLAFRSRIRGERAENLERAIEHYTRALEVYAPKSDPERWAMTHNNLANAYADRIRGERAENLEQAIEHFTLALEVYTRQDFPAEWAKTQNNLGLTYESRIRGERADNLERAIEHYSQALEVLTRQASLADWAMTQNNLAGAYYSRVRGEREENLERAIAHYNQVLEVHTRQAFPERWATTQNNLASAYAQRIAGVRADNLARAMKHYRQALEVRTLEQFPADRLRTLDNLGRLYFDMQNWQEADTAYEAAVEAGDLLWGIAYTEVGRRAEVARTARLYARAAYALLRMGRPTAALLKLEHGKTRLLSEALALADADLAMLPKTQQTKLYAARQRVGELEAEMRLPPDTPARRDDRELAALLHQTRTHLRDFVDAIRQDHPDFMPTGLGLSDILALIPEKGALVAPLVTSQGSAVFVLRGGVQSMELGHVILLEGFTAGDLSESLLGPEDADQLGGWVGAYSAFDEDRTEASFQAWCAAIDAVTQRLWEALMAPVHDRLQELGLTQDAPVILMPQGGLGLLPLHAAWREVDGVKRAFLDDYTVQYAPSAFALGVAQQRLGEAQRQGASLLTVVNPTGDLPFTPGEGEAVAGHFDPGARSVLVGGEATQEAVVAHARGLHYLHFACHGFYHWQDPMASGLLLAGSDPASPPDPFELREILSPRFDLSAARLVTLSACETGMTEFLESPDEYIGLPSGFLQAGAPAVVSSLWAVNDLSTALLMGEFYRRHLAEDEGIAEALRGAQRWLRDSTAGEMKLAEHLERLYRDSGRRDAAALRGMRYYRANAEVKPFAHPYYWAGFVFSGV